MKKYFSVKAALPALTIPFLFSGCVLLEEPSYVVHTPQPAVYSARPVIVAPGHRPKHHRPAPRHHAPKPAVSVKQKNTVINNTTVIVNKNEYKNTVKRPATGSRPARPAAQSTVKRPASGSRPARPAAQNTAKRPTTGSRPARPAR